MDPAAAPSAESAVPTPTPALKPHERTALHKLRTKLEEAISNNRLPCHHGKRRARVCSVKGDDDACAAVDVSSISLWGVPLLPSKHHEATDAVLLKFLRARDFKVPEALDMLCRTLAWRREFGADGILDEDLSCGELNGAAFAGGEDVEGHPVRFSNYGVFRNRELYRRVFSNEEMRERFLRWRVQAMERDIRRLCCETEGGGGAGSIVMVTDLKSSLNSGMRELRFTSKRIVSLVQENYPEFVDKNVLLNVSLRYYFYHALYTHFLSQKAKGKLVLARPSKVTETLLKFIAPENIPAQYGGFLREDDDEFSPEDSVSKMAVKVGSAASIVIPAAEQGVTLVWDLTVVGWEVSYKEEFIPDDEGSYRVLINKERKLEESVRNSFYISEPGKVVLTVDNKSFKKKKIFYRSKSRPTAPFFDLLR